MCLILITRHAFTNERQRKFIESTFSASGTAEETQHCQFQLQCRTQVPPNHSPDDMLAIPYMIISRKLLIILFIAYTILIGYLCLSPPGDGAGFQIWDKAAHALAYTGFALLCCLTAGNGRQLAILIALCFLFGIIIELLQGLTSYRQASLNDQLANSIGLLLGCCLGYLLHRFRSLPAFLK